jgi:hypothetical protein
MGIRIHGATACLKITLLFALLMAAVLILAGCVTTSGTALESHKKGIESIAQNEYIIPTKPVDRHYIGCAWSKQFGPVEDPTAADIRIRKEKSFSNVQQDFAYNLGIGLGGQSIVGPSAQVGAQGGSIKKAALEGVEIITPVSLADVPFEVNIPYITEALRLANFRMKEEKSNKAGIQGAVGLEVGTATALAEVGSQARRGTEGDGLVVAYKLHMIDPKTYTRQDTGNIPLEIGKVVDFSKASLFAKARLQIIEPGASKSLPRNLLWSCDRADAKSRDMVAAWIVELKSTDPKRKSLTIAFPGLPNIEDCQSFSGVIFSRLDPVTDKIIRQKVNVIIVEAELSDTLQPQKWEARISLVDESFKIKPVMPDDTK